MINPKNVGDEMREFLERAGLSWTMYNTYMEEIQVSHNGTMMTNEEGFSLSTNRKRQSGVPSDFAWADIQCIKSNKGSDGERIICFQSVNGLVHTLAIDGLMGEYSKFRM